MANYISKINTKGQELEIGGKNFDGEWICNAFSVCSNITIPAKSEVVYDISSKIPDDGYDYEIFFMLTMKCPATAGQNAIVYVYAGDSSSSYDYYAGAVGITNTRHAVQQEMAQSGFIPIKASRRKLVLQNSYSYPASAVYLYIKGYRRLGNNGIATNYISNINVKGDNIPIGGTTFDGGWIRKTADLCSGLSLASNASVSYDISSYIPDDGNTYELMVRGWGYTGSTSGNTARYKIITNTDYYIAGAKSTTTGSFYIGGGCTAMIDGSTRSVTLINTGDATMGGGRCLIIGYRKLGTNNDSKHYLSNFSTNNEIVEVGGNNFDGRWINKSYSAYQWTSLVSGTTYSIDISSYLPDSKYAYEIMVYTWCNTGTTSGNGAEVKVGSDLTNNMMFCTTITRASASTSTSGVGKIPISGNSRTLDISNGAGANSGSGRVWLLGYRRLGTNV